MMAEDEGVSSDDASSGTTPKEKEKTKVTIKEADSITFSALPPPQKFRQWRLAFKEEITNASSDPDLALRWLGDIERAKTWEELIKVAVDKVIVPRLTIVRWVSCTVRIPGADVSAHVGFAVLERHRRARWSFAPTIEV
jgi:hypothetical protein